MADTKPDAIALLKADHRAVEALFEQFEGAVPGIGRDRPVQGADQLLADALHPRAGGGEETAVDIDRGHGQTFAG